MKLIVAKARNGETGDIDLLFDKARMRFSVPQTVEHNQHKD